MPIAINYDPGEHLIRITYQGVVEPAMLSGLIAEAGSLIKQHGCLHILEDFREAQIQFSTVDIYDVPAFLTRELSAFALGGHQLKRAFIAGKDPEILSFLETVSFNQGQDVRLFRQIEEGIKWLSGK